jgi:hypothetical protein
MDAAGGNAGAIAPGQDEGQPTLATQAGLNPRASTFPIHVLLFSSLRVLCVSARNFPNSDFPPCELCVPALQTRPSVPTSYSRGRIKNGLAEHAEIAEAGEESGSKGNP